MALEQILASTRRGIAARRSRVSIGSLLSRCHLSDRSFRAALDGGGPAFILELKHASPSAGAILPAHRRMRILEAYGPHADAISIVTEASHFGGSLELLDIARRSTDLPLLCKDFILDPLQVAEARLHGADAVLLILAALDDDGWRSCAAMASRLEMDVLTEVHDESELRRAEALEAKIVGINSRDLRTFRIDRSLVARLAPLARPGTLLVAESGIRSRMDVVTLASHADAFLVGSSILTDPEPERAVRRLVYGMTKICGLTSPADASAAWAAGATHGGLVFEPSSPRAVTIVRARAIRAAAPMEWVGVFVDAPVDLMTASARELSLAAVQLHGGEDWPALDRLRAAIPRGCEIWKAHRLREGSGSAPVTGADRLLFDAPDASRPGGTGRTFDWRLLDGVPGRKTALLAGGLDPSNAARAAATGVAGLDVSTGVEASPGRKDPGLMRRFLRARRRLPGRPDQGR